MTAADIVRLDASMPASADISAVSLTKCYQLMDGHIIWRA
jgi:hypothetical protein